MELRLSLKTSGVTYLIDLWDEWEPVGAKTTGFDPHFEVMLPS